MITKQPVPSQEIHLVIRRDEEGEIVFAMIALDRKTALGAYIAGGGAELLILDQTSDGLWIFDESRE